MKARILLVVVILSSLLLVTACGDSDKEKTKTPDAKSATKSVVDKKVEGSKPNVVVVKTKTKQERCKIAFDKTVMIQKQQIENESNEVQKKKLEQFLVKLNRVQGEFLKKCVAQSDEKMNNFEKVIEVQRKLMSREK